MDQTTRRDQILDAAERHFFRVGFKKTTLEEIASELGIVKSAIYRHFGDKKDLFNAVIDRFAVDMQEVVQKSIRQSRTTQGRLRRMLHDSFERIIEHMNRYQGTLNVWHEIRPYLMETSRHHHKDFIQIVQQVLDMGIESGELCPSDSLVAANMIHLSVHSLTEEVLLTHCTIDEARHYIDQSVKILMNGLRKRG